MERDYYYFVASLPMVHFEGTLPFAVDEFLEDCRRLLHAQDYRLLEDLISDGELIESTRSRVFNTYSAFAASFLNEQAAFRAELAGRDPLDYTRGSYVSDPYHKEVLVQAQKAETPLEAQKIIDRFFWEKLDDLESGQMFGFGRIVIYALKLKILERYKRIEQPHGIEIFNDIKEIDVSLNVV